MTKKKKSSDYWDEGYKYGFKIGYESALKITIKHLKKELEGENGR